MLICHVTAMLLDACLPFQRGWDEIHFKNID